MIEKQDYEIYTATLQERNRIAREIHDNVGHLLSRCILIVGAMKIVNEDKKLSSSIEQLEESLNTAMTSVRESVHDLHDEAVNLEEVEKSLVREFTFCSVQMVYDMTREVPREVKILFYQYYQRGLRKYYEAQQRHEGAADPSGASGTVPALYRG